MISGPSDRVRIARETAIAMPDVVDLDPGIAGRFDVSPRLVCGRVAPHLGDRVRAAIQSITFDAVPAGAGVSVLVAEIAEPGCV